MSAAISAAERGRLLLVHGDILAGERLLFAERFQSRFLGGDLVGALALLCAQLIHARPMALELAGADRSFGAQAGQLVDMIVCCQDGQIAAADLQRLVLGGELVGQCGDGCVQASLGLVQSGELTAHLPQALLVPGCGLAGAVGGQREAAALG